MLHITPAIYHLPAAKQEPYLKTYLFTKTTDEFSEEKKSGDWANRQKKRQDRKKNRSRQRTKRGDSKVESNDSLEIPDKKE